MKYFRVEIKCLKALDTALIWLSNMKIDYHFDIGLCYLNFSDPWIRILFKHIYSIFLVNSNQSYLIAKSSHQVYKPVFACSCQNAEVSDQVLLSIANPHCRTLPIVYVISKSKFVFFIAILLPHSKIWLTFLIHQRFLVLSSIFLICLLPINTRFKFVTLIILFIKMLG